MSFTRDSHNLSPAPGSLGCASSYNIHRLLILAEGSGGRSRKHNIPGIINKHGLLSIRGNFDEEVRVQADISRPVAGQRKVVVSGASWHGLDTRNLLDIASPVPLVRNFDPSEELVGRVGEVQIVAMDMQPVDAERDRCAGGDSQFLVLEGDVEGARCRSGHAVQHGRVATFSYGLHGGLAILLALLEVYDGGLGGSSLPGIVGNVTDTASNGEDIVSDLGDSREPGDAGHLGDQLSLGVLGAGVQRVGAGVSEGVEE
ncbi:unnamed protein product [Clonostachys chloroleuca]|uniref:Uncharacterized protein n=1 Tax=Clonostachys chloroleuca TaxID=1926264 RepID=A0AA35LUN8_9HYPO|nr:unnamed protein product [Clonostachys chloroleuca]